MKVPFLDLKSQHKELEKELVEVFCEALKNAAFIGGREVEAFEKEFADFCGTKYCIGVNSGTDALRFAFVAAGIGPDDEVITVPNTFIATTEAISQAGATPVFIDVDERTYNMDPKKLEDHLKKRFTGHGSRVTSRSKAVVPVHLYGQPADMDAILEIAEQYRMIVIEDACQAHGAEYFSRKENRWRKAGSMSVAAAFSFYPGKNLGACGEAGAVTTNSEEIAQKIRMLRDHGQAKKYFHDVEGYNGRLDAIQAAILRIKLRHLAEWNERRRQSAYSYNQLFSPLNRVILPHEPSWTKAVYHLYVIRTFRRAQLQDYLSRNGITTALHYPIPLHLQKAYINLGYKEADFPVTEKLASEIISLPMYPGLTYDLQKEVVDKIKDFILS
jgi:dTDP-4-amino-4,6-dideoxygalactose transaminase